MLGRAACHTSSSPKDPAYGYIDDIQGPRRLLLVGVSANGATTLGRFAAAPAYGPEGDVPGGSRDRLWRLWLELAQGPGALSSLSCRGYFEGRRAESARIAGWLRDRDSGLLVVTGDADVCLTSREKIAFD